jgi:hypothetical protein
MFLSNTCEVPDLLPAEQVTIDVYNTIESSLKLYIDKGYKLDNYGESKANDMWGYGRYMVFLVAYLNIVRNNIQKDYLSCNLKTLQEYKQIYKLDCIREKFSCFSIPYDVDDLYETFGAGKSLAFTGIAYMGVEINGATVCGKSSILKVI